jgi:hypothetical protein
VNCYNRVLCARGPGYDGLVERTMGRPSSVELRTPRRGSLKQDVYYKQEM